MGVAQQTELVTIDNVGLPEPIFVRNPGTRAVKVWENGKADTSSYVIHEPESDSPGITVSAGEPYTFHKYGGGFYDVNTPCGYAEVDPATGISSMVLAKQERSHGGGL